ncbi:hypothetical protein [Pseudomonas saponiphila]|uniref:hypothetical protein n=1 Tax=Pseudomonas saponiphila TaxID=556534 RepID=UPI002AD4A45B|nr:hypothetical protein [Pseudomonas saponiphila]
MIYDKMACPTLRSSLSRQFPVKEQIPVDAVYAYIECKHSIATSERKNQAQVADQDLLRAQTWRSRQSRLHSKPG